MGPKSDDWETGERTWAIGQQALGGERGGSFHTLLSAVSPAPSPGLSQPAEQMFAAVSLVLLLSVGQGQGWEATPVTGAATRLLSANF